MTLTSIVRIAGVLAAVALIALDRFVLSKSPSVRSTTRYLLLGWGAINLLFVFFLAVNHVPFPLNLDLMEGGILQHFQRAAAFEAIYPEPSADFVGFAYNPLYYVVAVPFSWVFGVTLSTLRLVSVIAWLVAMCVIYASVKRVTEDRWWASIAVGLFAAAYFVMDSYLDTAHSDACLLAAVLLGTELIARGKDRRRRVIAVLVFVASFWFKQHGAIFTIGAVLYLTWQEGLRSSWPYWVIAGVLGPGLYLGLGPTIFGSHFHFFTWQVGSQWTQPDLAAVMRFFGFLFEHYGLLVVAIAVSFYTFSRHAIAEIDIWHFLFFFALATGMMGSFDVGSADQIYIPMGTWAIVVGCMDLKRLFAERSFVEKNRLHLLAVAVTFAGFLYNPTKVICDFDARASFDDLSSELKTLEADVWAPAIGQLSSGYEFHPSAHWVAVEDIVRGPGRDTENHPTIRALLRPLESPSRPIYVLSNEPLDGTTPAISYLAEFYVLERDYKDRFEPLRVLPGRWDHVWPRYLYRHRSMPPLTARQ